MEISPEQKKLIEDRIPLHQKPCWVCGENTWSLSDVFLQLHEYPEGALVVGEPSRVFPVIALVCGNCGHTVLFNAIQLGLIKSLEEEQDE